MKYTEQTLNFLKRHYPLILAIGVFLILQSCAPHCKRGFREGKDTLMLGIGQLLNLALFGTTSLGLGLAYNKRKKKEAHGLLIFSVLLFLIFANFTLRGLFFYGYDFADHPVLASLYCISAVFMVFVVINVYKGLNRTPESFNQAAKSKNKKVSATEFLDDEISDDEEIV